MSNLKSVMQHQFSQVPRADIPRSSFNRSHGYKTTFDSGYLVPFYVDEALPGDTFNLRANLFARLSTPIVPIMDNMFLEDESNREEAVKPGLVSQSNDSSDSVVTPPVVLPVSGSQEQTKE